MIPLELREATATIIKRAGSAAPAAALADTEVRDVAIQPDGKVIGVGRTVQVTPAHFVLTVFRLVPGGALDPSFGDGGLVHLGMGEGPTWRALRTTAVCSD